MFTGRAFLWRFRAFKNIAAINAMPLYNGFLLENLAVGNIGNQFTVSGFMEFLHLGNLFKGAGDFRETLIFSYF